MILAVQSGDEFFVSALSRYVDINVVDSLSHTPLMNAVLERHAEVVNVLLEAGANANWVDKSGESALSLAVSCYDIENVKLLLESGADSSVLGAELIGAAISGNTKVTKALIESGEDVNATGYNGYTPLMVAAVTGHAEIAKILLDAGANIEAIDVEGQTALLFAVYSKQPKFIEVLLSVGADVNAKGIDGYEVWHTLESFESEDEIAKIWAKFRTRKGIMSESEREALLIEVIRKGDLVEAKRLIADGVDINATDEHGKTALMRAVHNNEIEIAKVLISIGADVGVGNGWTVWDWIWGNSLSCDGEMARVLLQIRETDMVLINAAIKGQIDEVNAQLKGGVDVNVADEHGKTSLMYAAYRGHVEIIKVLLKAGADVNASNYYGVFNGWTALMGAVEGNHPEIVKLLLSVGANINAESEGVTAESEGFTALTWARVQGHVEIVKMLKDAGAN